MAATNNYELVQKETIGAELPLPAKEVFYSCLSNEDFIEDFHRSVGNSQVSPSPWMPGPNGRYQRVIRYVTSIIFNDHKIDMRMKEIQRYHYAPSGELMLSSRHFFESPFHPPLPVEKLVWIADLEISPASLESIHAMERQRSSHLETPEKLPQTLRPVSVCQIDITVENTAKFAPDSLNPLLKFAMEWSRSHYRAFLSSMQAACIKEARDLHRSEDPSAVATTYDFLRTNYESPSTQSQHKIDMREYIDNDGDHLQFSSGSASGAGGQPPNKPPHHVAKRSLQSALDLPSDGIPLGRPLAGAGYPEPYHYSADDDAFCDAEDEGSSSSTVGGRGSLSEEDMMRQIQALQEEIRQVRAIAFSGRCDQKDMVQKMERLEAGLNIVSNSLHGYIGEQARGENEYGRKELAGVQQELHFIQDHVFQSPQLTHQQIGMLPPSLETSMSAQQTGMPARQVEGNLAMRGPNSATKPPAQTTDSTEFVARQMSLERERQLRVEVALNERIEHLESSIQRHWWVLRGVLAVLILYPAASRAHRSGLFSRIFDFFAKF